jgi:pyruvate kinase
MSAVSDPSLQRLLAELDALRERAVAFEAAHSSELDRIDPARRDNARNLLHYLSLRQVDLGDLQRDLHANGLCSLATIESHVLPSLEAIRRNLRVLAGEPVATRIEVDVDAGARCLAAQADALLGPAPAERATRIMVTLPTEAAAEGRLLADLLRAGMDVMRINGAHDDAPTWRRMIAQLRRAEREVGRRCRVQLDLGGPKLRTGALAPLGRFVRLKPVRDPLGRVIEPASAWIVPAGEAAPAATGRPALGLPEAVLAGLQEGDVLRLADLRGRTRELALSRVQDGRWIAAAGRTVYVGEGARCEWLRGGDRVGIAVISGLPEVVRPLRLARGELLRLTREDSPGRPAEIDPASGLPLPARMHCTLAAAFDAVRPGHRVRFDDGRLGGRVLRADADAIDVLLEEVPPGGGRLGAGKGINLPDTPFDGPALTREDMAGLGALAGDIDLVAMSFLRSAEDVDALRAVLETLGAAHVGLVLKIETQEAFRDLPRILLAALRHAPAGIMVARGDLAVEVGFERLAEVQEEIVWLCEAARVPVVWATQVLESLARDGLPTRAEISDAVMSARAECVMLNKGPRIVDATAFLGSLLRRMGGHHDKRMARLRRLTVADCLTAAPAPARVRAGMEPPCPPTD